MRYLNHNKKNVMCHPWKNVHILYVLIFSLVGCALWRADGSKRGESSFISKDLVVYKMQHDIKAMSNPTELSWEICVPFQTHTPRNVESA